jgi:hypothetical protein
MRKLQRFPQQFRSSKIGGRTRKIEVIRRIETKVIEKRKVVVATRAQNEQGQAEEGSWKV